MRRPRVRWWSPRRVVEPQVSPLSPAGRGLGSDLQLDGDTQAESETGCLNKLFISVGQLKFEVISHVLFSW